MKASDLKKMPSFKNDEEAEAFVSDSDLTDYDLSEFKKIKYEFKPKSETINISVPESLLLSIKNRAKEKGIPYTHWIRQVLEEAVG